MSVHPPHNDAPKFNHVAVHPEANHGANAGLIVARDLLEPVKRKFGDDLTYSDLWTLAGVAAIQEMVSA